MLLINDEGNFINVVVYGAESKFKQFRDANTYSKIDAEGNAICGSLESVASTSSSSSSSSSSGGQSSVGSNCILQKDCEDQKDSICAYKGDVALPLDSSWGKFTCTTVAHAGFAVAAAVSWNNCYSGRCLLEADGTLFISQAAANATSKTVNGTSPTLDRYLQLHPNDQIWKTVNQSISTSNAKANSSSTSAGAASENSGTPTLTTGPFVCPCNSTYVSRSCCLTPIVFEDTTTPPGKNSSFHQIVRGPVGKCCDRDTGLLQDLLSSGSNVTDKEGACVESS